MRSFEIKSANIPPEDNLFEYDTIIIGAGAAGLGGAHYLKTKAPHERIAIFEASPESEIGGKVHSAIVDGIPYDMGAHIVGCFCDRTHELIKQYGLKLDPFPFDEYSCIALTKKYGFWRTVRASAIYWWLSNKHRVSKPWDFESIEKDSIRKKSVQQLIEEYDLRPLESIFQACLPGFGYGPLSSIPAGLAFSYIRLAINFMVPFTPTFIRLPLGIVQGGYQGLFQKMSKKLQSDNCILLPNTKIQKVEPLRGSGIAVVGAERRWIAKRVLITCSPTLLELPHLTAKERALFGSVSTTRYGTTLFRHSGKFPSYVNPNPKGVEPVIIGTPNPDKNAYVSVAYAYVLNGQEECAEKALRKTLRTNFGVEITEIYTRRYVNLWPRLPFETMINGGFHQLKTMNRNGIYFSGSVCSFESVEAVLQSSRDVVDRTYAV